ncbi:Hypothetical predicted protein [Mytilus galloprovincialis]|uniref:Uncharacterized protein n=1 Tax=Mytilus galloprovincialis TaxID=29158 RepID=A0A8B6GT28_MYTGA|nr:Hypothetical predicted protein [Mytilus galloprovincialis]
MVISGQTGSGKTRFVFKLLQHFNVMYGKDPPDKILYCYGIHQDLFDDMEKTIPGITFLKGIPTPDTIDDFTREKRHRLVIIDDLGHEVVKNQEMELIFTQGCHHRKLSCIFLNQNLYLGGSKARTIALNTTYLILMKNLRDVSQISMLGRQIYPGRRHLLMEAYRDANSKPFGYLVLDLAAHVSDTYRLRTRVFPNEDPIIYVPKHS